MVEKKDYFPDYIYALLNSSYISSWGLYCLIRWIENDPDKADEIANQYALDTNMTDQKINEVETRYGDGLIEVIIALLNHNDMSEEAKYCLIDCITKANGPNQDILEYLQPIYFPNFSLNR